MKRKKRDPEDIVEYLEGKQMVKITLPKDEEFDDMSIPTKILPVRHLRQTDNGRVVQREIVSPGYTEEIDIISEVGFMISTNLVKLSQMTEIKSTEIAKVDDTDVMRRGYYKIGVLLSDGTMVTSDDYNIDDFSYDNWNDYWDNE